MAWEAFHMLWRNGLLFTNRIWRQSSSGHIDVVFVAHVAPGPMVQRDGKVMRALLAVIAPLFIRKTKFLPTGGLSCLPEAPYYTHT